MVVDALERRTGLHQFLVQPGDRVLQVTLVEFPVLGDHVAHALARHAGPARRALPAARRAAIPGEDLRHALAAPAMLGSGQPEVPVLRAVDEDRIEPARLRPGVTAEE